MATLVVQREQLGQLFSMAVATGILRSAVPAFVGQGMTTRYYLRHGRDDAAAQAATADYEVAKLVQQAIADIVFCY